MPHTFLRLWLLCFSFLLYITNASLAYAHMPGQPAYLQTNGKYTNFYPVLSSSLNNFPLPQDMAPETYIVHQSLHFTIDTSKLLVPQYIIKQSTFYWDFGDGKKENGLDVIHSYTKAGPYLLTFSVNDGSSPENQMLDSVLLNILPNQNYKLPKAIISFDGQIVHDPITDTFTTNLSLKHTFDGIHSQTGSTPIVSYFWDLGDGTTNTNASVEYQYLNLAARHQLLVFPFLRIKDKNGFYVDTFVQLTNSSTSISTPIPSKSNTTEKKTASSVWIYATMFFFCLLLLGGFFLFSRKKK